MSEMSEKMLVMDLSFELLPCFDKWHVKLEAED